MTLDNSAQTARRWVIAGVLAALVIAAVVVAATVGGGSDEVEAGGAPASTRPPTTPPTTGPPNADEPAKLLSGQEVTGDLAIVTEDWTTDFSRTTIEFRELAIGIRSLPIRDRIRPIDDPQFETTTEASEFVDDREPGLAFELDGDARFYPLSVLTAHEIVNDVVGGAPVAVTYCPLCNSAIVFDATFQGEVLRFGVSGLLRNSDLIMWDDASESLWQQLTGEGIVGEFAGEQLTLLPSSISNFGDFKERFADGRVLGRDQGFGFNYGFNSYVGYSTRTSPIGPFFSDELDDRYDALERVVNVTIEGTAKAYPFSVLATEPAINDTVAGVDIVVLFGGDTADNLDTQVISSGRNVGTGIAFQRTVDGQRLTFAAVDAETFTDAETGTIWNLNGTALAGPLAGSQLEPVVHGNEFWFAWAAFNEGAAVYTGAP